MMSIYHHPTHVLNLDQLTALNNEALRRTASLQLDDPYNEEEMRTIHEIVATTHTFAYWEGHRMGADELTRLLASLEDHTASIEAACSRRFLDENSIG